MPRAQAEARQREVRKKILATLVYPALLIVMATIIVTYLVTAVIPKFATLYNDLNVPLPGPTRFLIALTGDYRYVFLGCIAALALLALGVYFWSRTDEGGIAVDRLKFRMPVVGNTLLKFQMAQFSRTLATLLSGYRGTTTSRTHSLQSAPDFVVEGAMVYQANSCSGCHQVNGNGMKVGP